MKASIRAKIDRAREEVVPITGQPMERREPAPTFLIEEAYLEERVREVMARLPQHKDWFTPQEVGFAFSRSDVWARDRFRPNPRCFNDGNGAKMYLKIPRAEVAAEVRKMYRDPKLRAS